MTVFFIVAIAAFKHFNLFGVTKVEFDSLQPHPILQMLMYWGFSLLYCILLYSAHTLTVSLNTSVHTQTVHQAKFLKMSFWTRA